MKNLKIVFVLLVTIASISIATAQETKQKLKGRKGSTSGKIGINNKISNKFIFEEELEKYLNEGWLKGLKSTKKDDIWQKKKK